MESNDKRSSDLATMQLEEAPFAVNEPRAEPAQAISPPPGFETMKSAQVAEPLLGNDDFVDVASITFKGEDERDEGRAFVQFDDDDDDGGDFIAGQKLDRNPAPGSHPLPALYFEPDHSSREESDDELEASSSVASFSMKEQPVNSHHNPTETLIEREIRLQREREEAVLRERQRALELVEAARKHSKTCETAPTSNHEDAGADKRHAGDVESSRKTVVETKRPPSVESNSAVSPAEIRISEEIRDLKRREEELRALREAHAHVRLQHSGSAVEHSSSLIASAATEDEGLYSDAERDACSEHNSRFE